MNGYCISDKYCRYKSDTGYCSYTAGCIKETRTINLKYAAPIQVVEVVDISEESINAIANAVVSRLKDKQDGGLTENEK